MPPKAFIHNKNSQEKKNRNRRDLSQHLLKSTYQKLIASILNGERLHALTKNQEQGKDVYSHRSYSTCIRSYDQLNEIQKRNKWHTGQKGRNETSLFAYDMIAYVVNPMESTKNKKQINKQNNPTPKKISVFRNQYS